MPERRAQQPPMSDLESEVMRVVWDAGRATAEDVREALAETRPLKESTVRTVLRRLEEKGYLRHTSRGRTYVYRAALPPGRAAARAARQLVDRFCAGSVEALLLGMVDDEQLSAEELRALAARIERDERENDDEQQGEQR